MMKMKILVVAAAIFAAACSGDSPSAPSPGPNPGTGGGGTGGGQTGVAVTVETSNVTPLVASTSLIRAVVTNNGQPAANGTAVEFTTTFGTFQETGTASALRTTQGGVASVTLTSPTAGPATVTVRVDNVVRTAVVTFREQQSTTVAITSVTPASGRASGGEQVTIQGRNFEGPVRVLFGDKEALVVSQTSTEIRVIAPAVNLGASQQSLEVPVVVLVRAGTATEARATAPTAFRYELQVLTPIIYSVSPASGPNEGNTRITIFGEGFQSPTRVYFGLSGSAGAPLQDQVELEVVQVNFNQIIAVTPPATGLGASLRDQQVVIRVENVLSNKDAVQLRAFRYGPVMRITAVGPTQGTARGGTTVTINGQGFDDPVAVTIGGIAAQPIRVSGTQIVAITGAPLVTGCTNVSGPISVTNIEDGASAVAEGLLFTFIVPRPSIVSVSPTSVPEGGSFTLSVLNGGANARVKIGDATVLAAPGTTTNGVTSYTVNAPANVDFATEACTTASGVAGTRSVPLSLSITFTDRETTCADTIENGITITPSAAEATCSAPPDASTPAAITLTGPCATPGDSAPANLIVNNTGGSDLRISGFSSTLAGFRVVSGPALPANVPAGGSATFQVVATKPTAPATPLTGTITVNTNDPTPPTPVNVTVNCTP